MGINDKNRKASSYVVEAAIAIIFCYFFFGGSNWSPAIWVIFSIFTVWVIVMNVRYEAGLESSDSYIRWKLQVLFIMALSLIGASIWMGSILLFIIAIALGGIWISNLRSYRAIQNRQVSFDKK